MVVAVPLLLLLLELYIIGDDVVDDVGVDIAVVVVVISIIFTFTFFLSTFTRVNVRTMMTAAGAFNNVEQKKKKEMIKKN